MVRIGCITLLVLVLGATTVSAVDCLLNAHDLPSSESFLGPLQVVGANRNHVVSDISNEIRLRRGEAVTLQQEYCAGFSRRGDFSASDDFEFGSYRWVLLNNQTDSESLWNILFNPDFRFEEILPLEVSSELSDPEVIRSSMTLNTSDLPSGDYLLGAVGDYQYLFLVEDFGGPIKIRHELLFESVVKLTVTNAPEPNFGRWFLFPVVLLMSRRRRIPTNPDRIRDA